MSNKISPAKTVVGVQLDADTLAKLKAEEERVRAAAPGARYSRSDVIRMVLQRGLQTK